MVARRVAVAGTHRSGKTTLVEAFGQAHPEFLVEPEPYEQLQQELGESPMDELSPESFERQLGHLCERIAATARGRAAIFDRSPLDFLAYLRATDQIRLSASDWALDVGIVESVRSALRALDLIAFVRPGRSRNAASGPSRSLRRLVDGYLSDLILVDALGLLDEPGSPQVAELTGSTSARLEQLTDLVAPRPGAGFGSH